MKVALNGCLNYLLKNLGRKTQLISCRCTMAQNVDAGCGGEVNGDFHGEKLIYPAASRNKEPILQVLRRFLCVSFIDVDDYPLQFLEVASGSGQHIAHFAPNFPHIQFQPSEINNSFFGSINAYIEECPSRNIKRPKVIDIMGGLRQSGCMDGSLDYMYTSNFMHITPYECTVELLRNAGEFLKMDGCLFVYGPFIMNGVISPESNVAFDASLRSQDPSWGLRDVADLRKLAAENDLTLFDTVAMPANNHILIFRKKTIPPPY